MKNRYHSMLSDPAIANTVAELVNEYIVPKIHDAVREGVRGVLQGLADSALIAGEDMYLSMGGEAATEEEKKEYDDYSKSFINTFVTPPDFRTWLFSKRATDSDYNLARVGVGRYPLTWVIGSGVEHTVLVSSQATAVFPIIEFYSQHKDRCPEEFDALIRGDRISPEFVAKLEATLEISLDSLSSHARHTLVSSVWNASDRRRVMEEHRLAGESELSK